MLTFTGLGGCVLSPGLLNCSKYSGESRPHFFLFLPKIRRAPGPPSHSSRSATEISSRPVLRVYGGTLFKIRARFPEGQNIGQLGVLGDQNKISYECLFNVLDIYHHSIT